MNQKERITLLHQQAVNAAKNFFRAEADLLNALQMIDKDRAYLDLKYPSLFAYAVEALNLSESTALNFINVARKAVHVPILQQEIAAGNLSVAKARKIVPVISTENQAEWIEKAVTLSSRKLEREVARIVPQAAQPERLRYISETRLNLSLSVDEKTLDTIKRVQDLECQRRQCSVTLGETLAAMGAFYLEKNDPIEKAKRANTRNRPQSSDVTGQTKTRPTNFRRRSRPAAVDRKVLLRDEGQCTQTDSNGRRCDQRRWLQVHHIQLVSEGGTDSLDNLTTLCSAHHRMKH